MDGWYGTVHTYGLNGIYFTSGVGEVKGGLVIVVAYRSTIASHHRRIQPPITEQAQATESKSARLS